MLHISFDMSLIDTQAIVVALVGYGIVFVALVMLVYVFNTIPKILSYIQRKRLKAAGKHELSEKEPLTGETSAAISMALYLYFNDNHDEESSVMTIKKISKTYTPWSSKIYGLRNYEKPYRPAGK